MRLKGKIALVTGASRGIGKAVALELASEGAVILVNYFGDAKGVNREEALETVKEIKELQTEASALEADVSDMNMVTEMFRKIQLQFKGVDILVNNAGINIDSTLKNMSAETWAEVISVNLNGVFNCTRSALSLMADKNYGRIINISSVVGQTGGFGVSNYAASKAGVIGFTKSIARETARKGITVNAIAPGFIDTPMLYSIPEKTRESILGQIPAGRWGKPEEIGKIAVFLASEDASYITGQVINVNGGFYM